MYFFFYYTYISIVKRAFYVMLLLFLMQWNVCQWEYDKRFEYYTYICSGVGEYITNAEKMMSQFIYIHAYLLLLYYNERSLAKNMRFQIKNTKVRIPYGSHYEGRR